MLSLRDTDGMLRNVLFQLEPEEALPCGIYLQYTQDTVYGTYNPKEGLRDLGFLPLSQH